MMAETYDVRIENPHAPDMLITGVSEDELGEVISRWCGDHTTVIVWKRQEDTDNEAERGN